MAIVVIPLSPKTAEALPGIAFPTPVLDYGTGNGAIASAFPVSSLLFPESQLSGAYWQFPIGAVGATPTVVIVIDWFPILAGAGNVAFSAQIQYSFSGGSQNALTTTLGTVATTASASNGTAFTMVRAAFTALAGGQLSNITASTVVGSSGTVALKIVRDGTSAADTLTSDIRVRSVAFTYQDT